MELRGKRRERQRDRKTERQRHRERVWEKESERLAALLHCSRNSFLFPHTPSRW